MFWFGFGCLLLESVFVIRWLLADCVGFEWLLSMRFLVRFMGLVFVLVS